MNRIKTAARRTNDLIADAYYLGKGWRKWFALAWVVILWPVAFCFEWILFGDPDYEHQMKFLNATRKIYHNSRKYQRTVNELNPKR